LLADWLALVPGLAPQLESHRTPQIPKRVCEKGTFCR
jgi:hypothetical protein